MKPILVAAALSALMLIGGSAEADDKSDITALYQKLQHAMKEQSSSEILALLAPDFSHKNRDGKAIDGKTFAEQIDVQKRDVKSIKQFDITVTSVAINGSKAQVTNKFAWKMEIFDTDNQIKTKKPQAKNHVMASTGQVTNELVKTPQGWRFLTLNTVEGKMTMDGKPIEHKPAAPQKPVDK